MLSFTDTLLTPSFNQYYVNKYLGSVKFLIKLLTFFILSGKTNISSWGFQAIVKYVVAYSETDRCGF